MEINNNIFSSLYIGENILYTFARRLDRVRKRKGEETRRQVERWTEAAGQKKRIYFYRQTQVFSIVSIYIYIDQVFSYIFKRKRRHK